MRMNTSIWLYPYVEQWGYKGNGSNVAFPIPFYNASWCVNATLATNSSAGSSVYECSIKSISDSNFTTYKTWPIYWIALGF